MGIMEKKMETTILYMGYIRVKGYRGYIGVICGEWKRKWKLLFRV